MIPCPGNKRCKIALRAALKTLKANKDLHEQIALFALAPIAILLGHLYVTLPG